ncbi:MAG: FMN-binding negative transcriptional regulator [Jannaschia sp.]
MHPNPAFRQTPDTATLAFARDRAFGTLAVNAEGGPLLSHVPILVSPDAESVDLHLVRSNPILRLLPGRAVISINGADGYVSPDWYEVPDQVPTWNYVAAHLRGRLERLRDGAMRDMLDRQSAAYEERLHPKTPWTADKMSPEVLERMMRQIVPCRLHLEEVHATWKLSQNKPEEVRLRAADAMENAGIGSETLLLSALMKAPPRA